jgi:CRISPR-associated protein Csc1
MQIYRGTLELLDYVFFATLERGKVYESGAFIHNYALAYALRLAQAPYTHHVQQPRYAEELTPLPPISPRSIRSSSSRSAAASAAST